MPAPRTYKTEAIVIRQISFGEADRILTLYSPDLGKIRAVAKGIRRHRNKLRGQLELVSRTSLSISKGRNLDTINEAKTIDSYRLVREELERLTIGLYLAELTDNFTVEQASNESIYHLLVDTLNLLGNCNNLHSLMRRFELYLLKYSGFEPELYHCTECQNELDQRDHLFSCPSCGVVCTNCRSSSDVLLPLSVNSMKILRFIEREPQFEKLEKLNIPTKVQNEVQHLLRTYIRYISERRLKTIELMDLTLT